MSFAIRKIRRVAYGNPCLSVAKAYFAGFHCCEKASADVATPISRIPAALASAETNKKGTAVVLLYLEHLKRPVAACKSINFLIKYSLNKYSVLLKLSQVFKLFSF
jgi:hypothetical protein